MPCYRQSRACEPVRNDSVVESMNGEDGLQYQVRMECSFGSVIAPGRYHVTSQLAPQSCLGKTGSVWRKESCHARIWRFLDREPRSRFIAVKSLFVSSLPEDISHWNASQSFERRCTAAWNLPVCCIRVRYREQQLIHSLVSANGVQNIARGLWSVENHPT